MGKRKYFTEEERKAAKREYDAKRYQERKEEIKEKVSEWSKKNKEHRKDYMRKYQETHKDKLAKYNSQYHSDYILTAKGRANSLLQGYRLKDKLYNRGECTLTDDWIVDNVFNGQCCHYCGESDWTKLGVDRKDSSLPHTKENCVPCCRSCNEKKHTTPYDEFMKIIGKIA